METLAELTARHARDGTLEWIGLRAERLGPVAPVAQCKIAETGLVGDHGRKGKRALSLIQAEHLDVIASLAGLVPGSVGPERLRRNLVVRGINLGALRGRKIWIGGALVEITVPCAPCSRMETELGPGGYTAMRGHGGWCARVVSPGPCALGDAVRPA